MKHASIIKSIFAAVAMLSAAGAWAAAETVGGRADELGSVTRNLYHYTRLYSGADPVMDEEDVFSITNPLNDGFSPEVGDEEPESALESTLKSRLKNTLESTLKNTDEKLTEIISAMPTATISFMQVHLGITHDGVNKALKRLKVKGIIRSHRRAGVWANYQFTCTYQILCPRFGRLFPLWA